MSNAVFIRYNKVDNNETKITNYIQNIVGVSCLFYFVLAVADYMQFKENPELYPIGGNWGWSYESESNYIFTSWIVICWSVTGMITAAAYRLKYNGTVSPEWAKFRKAFPNPTTKQIYEKAKEIDKLIYEHIRKRGY